MLVAGRCAKRPKDARKAPAACIARKRLKDRRQVLIARRKVDMEKQKKRGSILSYVEIKQMWIKVE